MSKFPHETKGFKAKFHGWYNMEPPPLPRSSKTNPTSLFSFVDSETPLKSIDQVRGRLKYETGIAEYWNHKLMKAEKELVDLNSEANEALYRASKQKTKADTYLFSTKMVLMKFKEIAEDPRIYKHINITDFKTVKPLRSWGAFDKISNFINLCIQCCNPEALYMVEMRYFFRDNKEEAGI
ncbi:hypothetical protein DVH24_034276 [Malus domestica]|uniref:Uncharacterized protein n=1 Tax=Malus domestica TaxID=3750 RepID=A0A498IVV6_MALDO|nr:hypothetical protein DVH24_034276 [Malus domestica]